MDTVAGPGIGGGGLVFLLGYFYGASLLHGGSRRPASLSAVIAFVFVGVSLAAAAGPQALPLRMMSGPSVRAQLLRWFLPITFVVVMLDRLLADASRWYRAADPAFKDALLALVSVGAVTLVLSQVAQRLGRRLDRSETARQAAEEGLRRAHEGLERRIAERTAQLAAANQELRREIEVRQRAEARFRLFLETSPDAIVIVDEQQGILLINSQAEKLFGYGREELLGRNVDVLVPERFREKYHRHRGDFMAQSLERPMRAGTDLWARRKDGSEFPAEISLSPLEAEGRPLVSAAIRDVSARREVEEALHQSEARFRQLAEHITDVFWMTDLEKNQMLYISPGYERVWGRTCESLYQSPRSWLEAIHPEDRDRVLQAAQTKQASGEYDEVYRILRPDGSARWIRDRGFPIRDEKGSVYRIAGVAADITQHKQAESQLAMLAHAVESTVEAICITDLEDRFIFVNRAFERIYGYRQAEILGGRPELLFGPENPPGLAAEVLAQTRLGGWQGEIWDRRKDGTTLPVFLSTSPIKDAAGRTLGLVGVSQDITERKRAEKRNAVFTTLGRRLGGATGRREAAYIILEAADDLFGWDAAYVHLYSEKNGTIVPILTIDTVEGKRIEFPPSSFPLDPSPLMREVMERGGRLTNRSKAEGASTPLVPFGDAQRRSESIMWASIHGGLGATLGVLSIQSYTPFAYAEPDLSLLQALADHCGEALRRVEAAEALRNAEAKYRSIFEGATEGIFRTTPEGRLVEANPALARMHGYESAREMIASVADVGRQIYAAAEARAEVRRLLETDGSIHGFETENVRKDGSKIWISLNCHVVRDATGAILYYEGTVQNITARKRLERELLDISTAERRRLGHELHDGLGQHLTGIALKAKLVEQNLAAEGSGQTRRTREVVGLINGAIAQMRNLAHGLDPIYVQARGLVAALESLADQVSKLFQVRCRFSCQEEQLEVSAPTGLAFYRIAQESLNNAVTHGQARRIAVELAADAHQLRLTIRDDGTGFNPEAGAASGMGLHIMRHRANSVGGRLAIRALPEGGTEVTCEAPREGPDHAGAGQSEEPGREPA